MGMYDNLIINCINCGKENVVQTKLMSCMMDTFEIGDYFELEDCVLDLKDECERCNSSLTIVIKDKRIIGTADSLLATKKELHWGHVEDLKNG